MPQKQQKVTGVHFKLIGEKERQGFNCRSKYQK